MSNQTIVIDDEEVTSSIKSHPRGTKRKLELNAGQERTPYYLLIVSFYTFDQAIYDKNVAQEAKCKVCKKAIKLDPSTVYISNMARHLLGMMKNFVVKNSLTET